MMYIFLDKPRKVVVRYTGTKQVKEIQQDCPNLKLVMTIKGRGMTISDIEDSMTYSKYLQYKKEVGV